MELFLTNYKKQGSPEGKKWNLGYLYEAALRLEMGQIIVF